MDWNEIEERLEKLEQEKCCCIKFYTTLPVTGKKSLLYVNKTTGQQFVWNGTGYVGSTSRIEVTFTGDGTVAIAAGGGVNGIRVKSTGALAAFKVGTTNGGGEVIAATTTTGSPTWDFFVVNVFDTVDYTLYFGGITASTDIIIYTR